MTLRYGKNMDTACKAVPIAAINRRPNVAVSDDRLVSFSTSTTFSFISRTKGFVHLGRYASKMRSEYVSRINVAVMAGIAVITGRKHGVKRAVLESCGALARRPYKENDNSYPDFATLGYRLRVIG
jgi:hypothetical protein